MPTELLIAIGTFVLFPIAVLVLTMWWGEPK